MDFQEPPIDKINTDESILTLTVLKKVDQIKKKDLTSYEKIELNHQYGSQIIRRNLWVKSLYVCSEAAIKPTLDTNPLTLIDSYFGEKPILGTVSQQIDEKGCFKKPKKRKLPSQNLAV